MVDNSNIILSPKHKAFLKSTASFEILEGTTYAGKTTVGAIKLMLKVSASDKRQHFIAGKDLGTVVKNIVTADNGILDIFGEYVEDKSNGSAKEILPHLLFHTPKGDKIIYLMGYDTSDRWKKALGGQYGCGLIDEMNIADIHFLREIVMRCDYVLGTLNPDDPDLDVYHEFINCCRPKSNFKADIPQELLNQLESGKAKPNWLWWYFTFLDNYSLTAEKKEQIFSSVPENTKEHKSKILGLRGKSEGLVYINFDRHKHCIDKLEDSEKVYNIILGIDEGTKDPTTVIPYMVTTHGRLITPPTFYYDPSEAGHVELAHSDIAELIFKYLINLVNEYGYKNGYNQVGGILGYCDSSEAGLQLTKVLNSVSYALSLPFQFMTVGKKDIIADKNRLFGLLSIDNYWHIINKGYKSPVTNQELGTIDPLVRQFENLVYDKKNNRPIDLNDHAIDAAKYGSYGLVLNGLL